MATDFNALIRKHRPQQMRRADMVIVPRELELEGQFMARRASGRRVLWLDRNDLRDFATSFAIFFTGAMIFLA